MNAFGRAFGACVLAITVLLVACAHVEAPQNNFERLVYAQATLASVADAAVAKYQAGKLTKERAYAIGSALEKANKALNVAHAVLTKKLSITPERDPAKLLQEAEAALRTASDLLRDLDL